jgi:hypothetical protein
MNDNDSQFPVRLFGILAIVAGVFIILGGGCFVFYGMMFGGSFGFGILGLVVGFGMIGGGARMINSAKKKDE